MYRWHCLVCDRRGAFYPRPRSSLQIVLQDVRESHRSISRTCDPNLEIKMGEKWTLITRLEAWAVK